MTNTEEFYGPIDPELQKKVLTIVKTALKRIGTFNLSQSRDYDEYVIDGYTHREPNGHGSMKLEVKW